MYTNRYKNTNAEGKGKREEGDDKHMSQISRCEV